MTAKSGPHSSELQLSLDLSRSELVRAFIREAALAEGALPAAASIIAEDTLEAWPALCAAASTPERARIIVSCSHREVRSRILLQGHSRFSSIVASLATRVRRDAGLSYRERGIDGWEVSVHRGLDQEIEPPNSLDEASGVAAASRGRADKAACRPTCRGKRIPRRSPGASSRFTATTTCTRRCSRRGVTGTRSRAASLFRW